MSYVQLPGLGLFKGSVSGKGVAIGAVAGLGGVTVGRLGLNKLMEKYPTAIPTFVVRLAPAISGALTGGLLYAVGKRVKLADAKSMAVGAVLAGVTVNVWNEIKAQVTGLNDLVSVQMNGYRGYRGVIVNNPNRALNGVIVDNPNVRSARNLQALHQLNMQPDPE